MARPQRNDVDYFPFICKEDKVVFYIEEKYGNDGYCTFLKLLIELASTNYHYINLSKKTTLMFLSAKCKIDTEKLLNIIEDLVELEKFDKELWEECSVIFCQDFIDSIQDAYLKRKNNCISKHDLITLLLGLGILKPTSKLLNSVNNPQRREEKRREEKRREEKSKEEKSKLPSFSEFKNYVISQKGSLEIDPEKLRLKFQGWVENDWKDGNHNPIKNWKTKILNTLPYLQKEKNSAKKEKEPPVFEPPEEPHYDEKF